jgi:hypothetical protein
MKLDEEHSSGKPCPASCLADDANNLPHFCYKPYSEQSMEASTDN